jgi:hypothetical protein
MELLLCPALLLLSLLFVVVDPWNIWRRPR